MNLKTDMRINDIQPGKNARNMEIAHSDRISRPKRPSNF